MKQTWPSPAKLNLFLYITGRRADGYHNLQTLFQFLDYGDSLIFVPRKDEQIQLLTPMMDVSPQDNLIMRAAHLLKHYCQQQCQDRDQHPHPRWGVDISIEKSLPIGGGLGGGSSNAATVLVALNHLWQCGLNDAQLANLGLQLGADVPVFIYGRAAFAQGIGEQLQPAYPAEKWYLVAHPGISVPTAMIFSDPALKRDTPIQPLSTLLQAPYTNDCEPVVRKRFPEVEQVISWLLEYAPARLTGTGACVFAEFDSELKARQLLSKAPNWLHGFVARAVNISALRRHSQIASHRDNGKR